VENNLKHWNAVSEFFPPTDSISRNYYLKSQLQIARLHLDGEDFTAAESNLRTIIDSPYGDEILRTIARIELGWIKQRGRRQPLGDDPNNEYFARAIRDMSTLIPEKQRIIQESLPPKVKAEWERIDYLKQNQPKPTAKDNATGENRVN
jgi:hypothetical protein